MDHHLDMRILGTRMIRFADEHVNDPIQHVNDPTIHERWFVFFGIDYHSLGLAGAVIGPES